MNTLKDLAEYLDMSDRNLRDVLKKIGLVGVDVGNPLEVDRVRVEYIKYLREMASGRGGEEQGRLAAARIRETELKGDKLELELAQTAETLVDAEEISHFFSSMVLSTRSELMSLTAKIVDHMQAEHNVEIDKGFINGLIRGTLSNLERYSSEDNEQS